MNRWLWVIAGLVSLASLLVLLLGGVGAVSADGDVQVWGPGSGGHNLLGGNWGAFSALNCQASAIAVPGISRQPASKAIKVSVRQQGTKPCGLWMHLFNENASAESPSYPSAGSYLIFWIRGMRGGEDFSIAMADAELLERDDTRIAGSISRYLAQGVSTQWQPMMVPLRDFGLRGPPASLAILFEKKGEEAVFIDDIELSDKPSRGELRLRESPVVEPPRSKAMWVWSTQELLEHAASRQKLFAFAREQNLDQIFLQILYKAGIDGAGQPTITLDNPAAFRAFLAEASRAGIRVHALDGYPEFVLRENHARMLALVRAILEFNRTASSDQRFYGIHLDNEPYLLIGFDGPERDSILRQFIELNQQVMGLLRDSARPPVYGVDIPFWFADILATPENAGAPSGGGTASLADRILDLVDDVCIMDYRTEAGGLNGIIEHARSAVYYANRVVKRVFIGVETFRDQPTPIHFLYGVTEAEWNSLAGANAPLMLSSRLDGFPLRIFDDGVRRYVGVASPQGPMDRPLKDVLKEIYSIYGATARGRQADLSIVTNQAHSALARCREYSGFEPFDLGNDSPVAGFITTEQMLASTTFDGQTRSRMDKVLRQVIDYFHNDPGFYGIAIDDYDHYRTLRP